MTNMFAPKRANESGYKGQPKQAKIENHEMAGQETTADAVQQRTSTATPESAKETHQPTEVKSEDVNPGPPTVVQQNVTREEVKTLTPSMPQPP